eukprot:GABV01014165.1.p1 GENE.GABV01014165.1~~GABV01014165.1.p1  ORF type:complete len:135 (-),score=21.60 GABV01014165.1:3-407(-)
MGVCVALRASVSSGAKRTNTKIFQNSVDAFLMTVTDNMATHPALALLHSIPPSSSRKLKEVSLWPEELHHRWENKTARPLTEHGAEIMLETFKFLVERIEGAAHVLGIVQPELTPWWRLHEVSMLTQQNSTLDA